MITTTLNVPHLRSELARRGWDGKRLALKSGVDPATISRGMQGRPVLVSTATKIADALNGTEPRPELAALVAG